MTSFKNSDLNNAYVLAVGWNILLGLVYMAFQSVYNNNIPMYIHIVMILAWFYSIRILWSCKCK